jgi:hypothetical protein
LVNLCDHRVELLKRHAERAGRRVRRGLHRERRRPEDAEKELGHGAARSQAPRPAGARGRRRDSALGFWAAVGAVWPETESSRCWVHRLANVLDKLPMLQLKAK